MAGPITNIKDDTTGLPARGLPIFTIGMLVAIVGIHAYVASLPAKQLDGIYFEYALIPARFTMVHDYSVGGLLTFLTHALLHANWGHVLANSYALFLFGLLAERFLGTTRVIAVYVASAIGGALLFMALDPDGFIPLVGASGAISGLFGAAILAAPQRSRKALMNNAFLWLAANVAMPALINAQPGGPRIAWEAHLGGFLVGLAMGWMLRASLPRSVITNPPAGAIKTSPSSPASQAGAKKPEPFNPVQRRR
jgi:membrane associated rhomboid family serine protease